MKDYKSVIKMESIETAFIPSHNPDEISGININNYEFYLNKTDPSDYYNVRVMIEEKLLYEEEKTGIAHRLSLNSVLLLALRGIRQDLLDQLEKSSLLLKAENQTGRISYCIASEQLVPQIRQCKTERITKEQTAQQREQTTTKIFQWVSGMIVIGLIVIGQISEALETSLIKVLFYSLVVAILAWLLFLAKKRINYLEKALFEARGGNPDQFKHNAI